jgi:hypothetical protein
MRDINMPNRDLSWSRDAAEHNVSACLNLLTAPTSFLERDVQRHPPARVVSSGAFRAAMTGADISVHASSEGLEWALKRKPTHRAL